MKKDPVIDEIREIRHKISEEFGHDSDRFIDYLIEKEKESVKKGEYRFIDAGEHYMEPLYKIA